jgi:hypothetical protein
MQKMKLVFLFTMFLYCGILNAQDSVDIKRIDSIAGVISTNAATKKHKVVEGTLLLEGNKTSSIRFHLDTGRVEMIVVESPLKDNVTLYYTDDKKLLHVVNFTNGNYNEIQSSFYFIKDAAYRKDGNNFKKIKPNFFTAQVSSYLDLFKEQLNTK